MNNRYVAKPRTAKTRNEKICNSKTCAVKTQNDDGFVSVTMAVSILLIFALLFSAVQVRWTQSNASDIQFVADASAASAENVVAKYYTIARVTDAVVLSMSLLSLTMFGVSTVLCCVPPTIPIGVELMGMARHVSHARDTFGSGASKTLNGLQGAIPFLCMANASRVASLNSTESASYMGTAIPLPLEFENYVVSKDNLDESFDKMEKSNEEVAKNSSQSEQSQNEMKNSKLRAYMADCGNNPEYCMFERAKTLANASGFDNPYYSSSEVWSFGAALKRAQTYYRLRAQNEHPQSSSLEERVRSACRKRYYEYAVKQMDKGYVHESETTFEAYFPTLPANTNQMKETTLYTDVVWPVSTDLVMHGTQSCPKFVGVGFLQNGSLAQLDSGQYSECSECNFKTSSMGRVGAPSNNIKNGFEFHLNIVAEEASNYKKAFDEFEESQREAKGNAEQSFSDFVEAFKKLTNKNARFKPHPPGRYGAVAIVADPNTHEFSELSGTSFLSRQASIGPRVAISAAVLGSDAPIDGQNIISSMFEGLYHDAQNSGSPAFLEGAFNWVVQLWGGALTFYSNTVDGVSKQIESVLNSIPVVGESGFGSWARDAFLQTLESFGLEPLDMSAPKPVVANTMYVLEKANMKAADILSAVRGIAGISEMPENMKFDTPFGSPIEVFLPSFGADGAGAGGGSESGSGGSGGAGAGAGGDNTPNVDANTDAKKVLDVFGEALGRGS